MKTLLCSLLFTVFLAGCVNKDFTLESGLTITVNNDLIESYSFVKSARYVFLESAHPLARIDRLILHNDSIVILDRAEQSIFIFEPNGAFISKLNHQGRGPGQYINLDDFTIDHHANCILVLDRSSRKILYYNFAGVFQKDLDLSRELYNRIAYTESGIFLQNSSQHFYKKESLEYYHSLLKYDTDSNSLVGFLAGGNPLNHITLDNKAFFRNGENLYYNDRWSFDVYKIDIGDLSKVFSVDFTDNSDFYDCLKEISDIDAILDTQYAFDLHDICINDEFICFKYHKDRKPFNVIYNRAQNKIVHHSNNVLSSSNVLLDKMVFIYNPPEYCNNEEFISIIQPYMIKNIYDNYLINNPPKDFNRMLEMGIYDNPLLVFYKFSYD